ncbi:ATP-binding protein [Streptomyces sp. NPDC059788]|uniref:ATP-binding protein n=1 Tax=Streptomyces sp. NPDC059788 TaxID=3346948 RepID=UPI003653BC8B
MSWRTALPHTTAAVPLARALVRTALAQATAPDTAAPRPAPSAGAPAPADRDTAELLTAELVANAVEHTPGSAPLELVVELLPGGCQVEVHDHDPAPVAGLDARTPAQCPDPSAEHGRGLLLVRTLSSAAGCRTTAHGKAVWFTLPPAPRHP